MAGSLRIWMIADMACFGANHQMTKSLVPLCRIKRWISHWSDRATLAPKQILYHTHHTVYWCTWKLATVTRAEYKYIFSTKDMNSNFFFWVFFSTWVKKRLREWVSHYRPSLLKVAALYWWQTVLTKNIMTFAQAWITALYNGS